MRITVVTVLAVLAGTASAAEPRGKPSPPDATADRGIAYLSKEALSWQEKRKCVSCHHASLVVRALREAKQRGHAVDGAVLDQLTKWLAESGDGKTGVARPASAPKALNEGAVLHALAVGADATPDAASREGLKRFVKTMEADQTADGSWSSWPETRQPIFGHSDERTTVLATLALLPAAASGDKEAKAGLDKGVHWLAATKSDGDAQVVAMRLVLWRRLGRPAGEWEPLVRKIKERQNADGGWSQTPDMPSDAWATGQALYALAEAGAKPDEPVLARGRAFLSKTQRPDGSWPMTSRPIKPGDAGATNLSPITCAGSAWAVLGLVRSR
jgi:hypothetical protein